MTHTFELWGKKGHGEVRVAHNLRENVPPHLWGSTAGTDFWLVAGNPDSSVTGAADVAGGLSGWGWTTTSLVFTNLKTGDFFSDTDDTPPHFLSNATGDLIRSPVIFGSYSHRLLAAQTLSYLPTRLVCEFYAAFTVGTTDEVATYIGFDDATSVIAGIYSDGTNFLLTNGSAEDAGAAIDTDFHQWKIVLTYGGSMEWFIDGTSQGTVAIIADKWPCAFAAVSSTDNRFALAWAHVWYQ